MMTAWPKKQPVGITEALSKRRAVVHVIGRELQRNSVKRA